MGSKGGGTSTNTVTNQSQPPAAFQTGLGNALTAAQNAASTPYQNYPGQLQAGFTPDQLAGFSLAESTPGIAAPYINTAAQDINAATTPIWGNVQQYGNGPSQYFNPYVQNVVNATQAQFNNQNQQQQNQLRGNAASQGALGGDRLGVAQGVLAGQQQLSQAPTIAGLYNTGFGQAQQEFNQQQGAQIGANEANAWLNSQAGFGMANLGNQALQSTLTSANALEGAGGAQQGFAQQALNIPYEQWVAQQAYPFQTASWLAGTTGQLANAAGGTASTTSPGANPYSQAAGLGAGAVGLLGQTGAFGANGYLTGANGLFSGLGTDAAAAGAGITSADLLAATTAGGLAAGAGPTAAGVAAGLAFGANRGGAVPHRAGGGPVSVSIVPSAKGNGFGVPQMTVDPSVIGGGTGGSATGGFANYLNSVTAGNFVPPQGAQAFPGQISTAPAAVAAPAPTAPASTFVGDPTSANWNPTAINPDTGFAANWLNGTGKSGGRAGSLKGFAAGGDIDDDVTSGLGAEPLENYSRLPMSAWTDAPASDPFDEPQTPEETAEVARLHVGLGGQGHGPPAPPPAASNAAPLTLDRGAGMGLARDTGEPLKGMGSVPGASPWLALADAGFATAAGRSPHALENIGAGLQHGVESYMNHDQAARALSARIDEARARLQETREYHQDLTGVRQDAVDNRLAIANKAADLKKMGLDDAAAWHQAEIEVQQGNLGVHQQQANTGQQREYSQEQQGNQRLAQGDQRVAQGADRIAIAKARLSMTQADQQQRAQARANGAEDAAALRIIGSAALNGKVIPYADALAQARSGRGGAGAAPMPQATDPLGIRQ